MRRLSARMGWAVGLDDDVDDAVGHDDRSCAAPCRRAACTTCGNASAASSASPAATSRGSSTVPRSLPLTCTAIVTCSSRGQLRVGLRPWLRRRAAPASPERLPHLLGEVRHHRPDQPGQRLRALRAAPRAAPGSAAGMLVERVGQFADARDRAIEAEFVEIVGDRRDRLVDRAAQRDQRRRQSRRHRARAGGGKRHRRLAAPAATAG